MARILYHYEQSVFSRRTRLVLACKGIEVELKEGRSDAANIAAARAIQPIRTMPVFVDDDGTIVADSTAILQYVELAYPKTPLLRKEALPLMVAVDVALNALVDLGTRLFDLRNDPAWAAMKDERMARAHDAINAVAAAATKPHLAGDGGWSAADIWVYAATRWISAFPGRIESSPAVKNMVTLGFELPAALVAWAKQHDARPDVRSIYG
jgi:glutathione S-transferase